MNLYIVILKGENGKLYSVGYLGTVITSDLETSHIFTNKEDAENFYKNTKIILDSNYSTIINDDENNPIDKDKLSLGIIVLSKSFVYTPDDKKTEIE